MQYKIHHIHITSADPASTAGWLAEAFGYAVVSDETRVFGDRFIRLRDASDVLVMVSGPRTGEVLEPAVAGSHLGLDHFGVRSADLVADLARLTATGARLVEGPTEMGGGIRSAFLLAPGGARVELIEGPAI